jgi:superfamily II DNA or RNA helicase
MNLRPSYQIPFCDSVCKELETHNSTLGVLATGLGKTVCAAEIIKRFHERTGKMALFLAHRAELIRQGKATIEHYTGYNCEIEMADERAEHGLFTKTKVIISTVQTQTSGRLKKRFEKFKPSEFSLVVIDEAHRGAAPSYKQIVEYYRQNSNCKILGITATPQRADEESLGQVFESVAYDYGILSGVRDGWLVDVTQQFIKVESLDWSECRTTAGDLNAGDVAKVVEKKENIAGICHPSLEVIYGLVPGTLTSQPLDHWPKYLASLSHHPRRTIVFTATVKQAEECCHIFNTACPGLAEWVCGETHPDKRMNLLERFKSGRTAVVCNVGVLSEGYDNPSVEVVIMGKATKSLTLYTQQVGRATRPLPGVVDEQTLETPEHRKAAVASSAKPICRIVDFVGNSGRHKLVNSMHVLGGDMTEEAIDRAVKEAVESKRPKRVLAALTNAEHKLKREQEERAREIERQRLLKVRAPKAQYQSRDVDPFGNETFRSGKRNGTAVKEIPIWMTKKIRKHGMKEPVNYGQAKVFYRLCKDKEARIPIMEKTARGLQQKGINTDGMTEADGCAKWKEVLSERAM